MRINVTLDCQQEVDLESEFEAVVTVTCTGEISLSFRYTLESAT